MALKHEISDVLRESQTCIYWGDRSAPCAVLVRQRDRETLTRLAEEAGKCTELSEAICILS